MDDLDAFLKNWPECAEEDDQLDNPIKQTEEDNFKLSIVSWLKRSSSGLNTFKPCQAQESGLSAATNKEIYLLIFLFYN